MFFGTENDAVGGEGAVHVPRVEVAGDAGSVQGVCRVRASLLGDG